MDRVVHGVAKSWTHLSTFHFTYLSLGFTGGASDKEPVCQCKRNKETWVQPLGQEDLLEEGIATHSSIPAWRIPMPEEPDGKEEP